MAAIHYPPLAARAVGRKAGALALLPFETAATGIVLMAASGDRLVASAAPAWR